MKGWKSPEGWEDKLKRVAVLEIKVRIPMVNAMVPLMKTIWCVPNIQCINRVDCHHMGFFLYYGSYRAGLLP
jgi:hypothetical protein